MNQKISLLPDPRILPMLGEINLSPERCIAELVDNAIDGFLFQVRLNQLTYTPQVDVNIAAPRTNVPATTVSVRDNGPGMTIEVLERAVRAGWTSNDPINNLGLFGMGFNIATARLGRRTYVWTTLAGDREWKGIEINFDLLIKNRSFETDVITRVKADPDVSGTEVVIETMKQDQAEWFAKQANQNRLKRFLADAYSAMLRQNGKPVHFILMLNARAVEGKRHCVWAGEPGKIIVPNSKHGNIDVFQTIDRILPSGKYCTACWAWLPVGSDTCQVCSRNDCVQVREQRIYGWIGVLRYLSQTDFGIDFIRNGRKIEMRNRDLFQYEMEGTFEDEYPIDDPRRRGRIVGEIHLDHCRVTYTKDRFYRDDHAWHDMVETIRGRGPLQPQKAIEHGYPTNSSPLFLLYQAFRRSTPQNKVAGCYKNLLIVPDNERAKEMAEFFDAGNPLYHDDTEWLKLIQEADSELLVTPKKAKKSVSTSGGSSGTIPVSGTDGSEIDGIGPDPGSAGTTFDGGEPRPAAPPYKQVLIPSLTREYIDDCSTMRFNVESYEVDDKHPALLKDSSPWCLQRDSKAVFRFFFNKEHDAFWSTSLSPADALIAELANQISLFIRDRTEQPSFSYIVSGLRAKYLLNQTLDPSALGMEARQELIDLARWFEGQCGEEENQALFNSLPPDEQRHILTRMANAAISDAAERLKRGSFLQYVAPLSIVRFFESNPKLFLDGLYWDAPYEGMAFNDPVFQKLAQDRVLRRFASLLEDIAWLAELEDSRETSVTLAQLHRAKLALDIIRSERVRNE